MDETQRNATQFNAEERIAELEAELRLAWGDIAVFKDEAQHLKAKVDGISTLLFTYAIFFHDSVNHKEDFDSCDAPVCRVARTFREGADIDAAKVFAEKERNWLAEIVRLDNLLKDKDAENERLRELLRDGLHDIQYLRTVLTDPNSTVGGDWSQEDERRLNRIVAALATTADRKEE